MSRSPQDLYSLQTGTGIIIASSAWFESTVFCLFSLQTGQAGTKAQKGAAPWQNQQNDCAPSEDSDQPGHPPSLIRVFAVRTNSAWVLSYPLSAQRRLIRLGGCPGWSEASLGAQSFCWFCHGRLKCQGVFALVEWLAFNERVITKPTNWHTCEYSENCPSKLSLSRWRNLGSLQIPITCPANALNRLCGCAG